MSIFLNPIILSNFSDYDFVQKHNPYIIIHQEQRFHLF